MILRTYTFVTRTTIRNKFMCEYHEKNALKLTQIKVITFQGHLFVR